VAECWAGGMELGGGFSLRSFVNPPPPLAPASRTLTLRLQSLRRVLGCLGRFAGGVSFTLFNAGNFMLCSCGRAQKKNKGQAGLCHA
jgi:hypothetical protein